jgi:hypothetical protein
MLPLCWPKRLTIIWGGIFTGILIEEITGANKLTKPAMGAKTSSEMIFSGRLFLLTGSWRKITGYIPGESWWDFRGQFLDEW